MRLRQLNLTRYGKFTNEVIDFGPKMPGQPDLHIIYGLNEAGKSTTQNAYLDLMFGIETKSRYDFLHAYSSMEIGALVEFDDQCHEVVRIKARNNSLLDAKRNPLGEGTLTVPLAGLNRDSYRSMFSLDDQSLEDGGNAIMASKGELGELLFAASAGLADIGQVLTKVNEDADAIYKSRTRSNEIALLKKTLSALKEQQDEIDTRASAHAALVAALEQAQTLYNAARTNQGEAKARFDTISRILRAAPLAVDYTRLLAELEAFADLKTPPADWSSQLNGLIAKNAELAAQVEGAQRDLARCQSEIEALVIDDKILAEAGAIEGLSEAISRYTTAQLDLPRRKDSLVADEANVSVILKALGQEGHATPDTLALPVALVGTLRELMEARSGLDAKHEAARDEVLQARDYLERARESFAALGGAEIGSTVSLDGVNAALGVLRRAEHKTRMAVAERDVSERSRRYQTLMAGLAGWSGDGAALRSVSLPSARVLEAWQDRARQLDAELADLRHKRNQAKEAHASAWAQLQSLRSIAGAIDDVEALRLRGERDAAWSAHMGQLNTQTATTFHGLLTADDELTATRLERVSELAQMRNIQHTLAIAQAKVEQAETAIAELVAASAALSDEIAAGVNGALALPEDGSALVWISTIEGFSRRRDEVLSAWDALSAAEADLTASRQGLDRDLAVLAEAMRLAGFSFADDLSAEALMQTADTAISQSTTRQANRLAAEKTLRDRETDLMQRERALTSAQLALDTWQEQWNNALDQTWMSERGVGAVRGLLGELAKLPAALTERNGRLRQITSMERDQRAFVEQLTRILDSLGETLGSGDVAATAKALVARFTQAEQLSDKRDEKLAEVERLKRNLEALEQASKVHAARKGEMTSFFAVETLEEVSVKLAEAQRRTQLRAQLEDIGQKLSQEMLEANVEAALAQLATQDLNALQIEKAETAARLEDLEAVSHQRFADQQSASEKLEAIGGDDAVARLETQRRTVSLEIEDKALHYLRLRTGAMVAEQALRAYREQHRSSMMDRASAAFAQITNGEYTGLATRPEKDKETVIGMTRQGGSRLAQDMSKGTQFQLYLALRLAGYHEFARSRPAVPFIADDIMETFDEPRSEQVFRLLGDMANIGQVIYLTHHRHLCDIAKAVVPGVTIHELGTKTLVGAA